MRVGEQGRSLLSRQGERQETIRRVRLLICGSVFTASSFARTSHVMGKRIIHDGMQFETDFLTGHAPGGYVSICKSGGSLALLVGVCIVGRGRICEELRNNFRRVSYDVTGGETKTELRPFTGRSLFCYQGLFPWAKRFGTGQFLRKKFPYESIFLGKQFLLEQKY